MYRVNTLCRYICSRAVGSSPSPTMASSNWGSSGPSMARRNADCRSRNAGIDRLLGTLDVPLGRVGFATQHSQVWDMRVPLEQGGHRANAGQRVGVEGPDRGGDWRTMIINQDRLAIGVIRRVPRDMDFTHRARRQGIEVGERVTAKIPAAHVDVVDIAQESTARTPHQFPQKLGLGDHGVGETQVTGWILDEETTLQDLLRVPHMLHDDVQGLLR